MKSGRRLPIILRSWVLSSSTSQPYPRVKGPLLRRITVRGREFPRREIGNAHRRFLRPQLGSAMPTQSVQIVESLLTVKEVASRLRVCRRTVEREIALGRFPRPLKIGRSIRVPESDLRNYVESLRASAPPSS